MDEYKTNNWVRFLRQYGPLATNHNNYDELSANSAKRNGVRPLRFDTGGLLERLVENFRAARPDSVVLTGTAGDGKTFLCREIWERLGGDKAAWNGPEKLRTLTLPSGLTLHVVKDLSEVQTTEARMLIPMAEALENPRAPSVWLTAANDGQLLEAWKRVQPLEVVLRARRRIEDLLLQTTLESQSGSLRLYNLSRQPSAALMKRALDAIAAHEGWRGCDGCKGQSPDPALRCPVWENHQRLQDPLLRERLSDLLELGDRSGAHIPVRQLLILASNMLLGHPGEEKKPIKDQLLRCQDVPQIVRDRTTHRASLYRNAFGENLAEARREQGTVFAALRRFGIGEETSNRLDNLLIYGRDEEAFAERFRALFGGDPLYGAHAEFDEHLSAYLDGSDAEKAAHFATLTVAQRQRLFFTLPADAARELGLWELTVFQHAGDFLNRVVRPVLRGERVDLSLVRRLVRGLNRVFTGMLTAEDERLWLASSGSHSQARVSRIAEHAVPIQQGRRGNVAVKRDGDGAALEVQLDGDLRLTMPLHLVRYEFLLRVADGALPSNFSRECYEDILSFKSRLLRAWRTIDRADDPERPFELRVLELGHDGKLDARSINLDLGAAR